MYKTELIKAMVKKTEEQNVLLSAKQMDAALSALMESVTEALKNGEKVVLPGFGMFAVKTRPARRGYNPLTGEQIALPEKKLPAFKAGKTLKDVVAAE
jgi:DNA-binding protein HU-beta